MPYDPSYPAAHSPAASAPMRAQFQAVVDLIETIPVGPQGPQGVPGQPGPQGEAGPPGPPFTSFVVDSTSNLDPGEPAWVQSNYDGTWVRFSFGIPRGYTGLQGTPGQNGTNGTDGAPGPSGPPFTSFVVDGTNTLDPGQAAYVQSIYDGTYVRFTFGIPRGPDGQPGPEGPQGPPGEVTSQQLAAAIAGTANNTNPIATLDIPISDPPTQSEVEQMLGKMNELIVALRRAIP